MNYRKTKVGVLDSKEWYNKAAKLYSSFHKELASYDKWLFKRFLPRDLNGKSVLDVGAGDARVYSYFHDHHARYVAMDIAEKLLKRAPGRVERVVADIEEERPFADEEFQVVLCFFVLLHISDLSHFFAEAYRVLSAWGKLIVLQNYQRRSYEYNIDGEQFKIQDWNHSHADIVDAAHGAFFAEEHIELVEKGVAIGMIYCFTK